MNPLLRSILLLVIAGAIFAILLPGEETGWLVLIFLAGFIIVAVTDYAGRKRSPSLQGLFSLGAISLKFIVSALAALVWFRVLKNTTNADLLLFFVLYLSFTLLVLFPIMGNLKKKP